MPLKKSEDDDLPDIKNLTPLVPDGVQETVQEIKQETIEFFKNYPESILEDAKLDTPQYCEKYGYPTETHKCKTDDGYILTLHRLPYGNGKSADNRPPALLVHGIMSSSADWVISGKGYSLAFALADNGYDVWLANTRGNTYSRQHVRLTPYDAEFWNFSQEDVGQHDIPAIIDTVLKINGESKLVYIGHSHGTSVNFILLSELPQYNDKIKVSISLSPIVYMNHLVSPIMQLFNPDNVAVNLIVKYFGNMDAAPHDDLLSQITEFFALKGPTRALIINAEYAVCGFSPEQAREEIVPVQMGHSPAGASTKQMIHYGQEMKSGEFCKWDFGESSNQKHYGQENPPHFKLYNVTCPQILFFSENDWLSSPIDVGRLLVQLTGCRDKVTIKTCGGKFNHLDYLFGKDAPKEVNDIILERLKKYR